MMTKDADKKREQMMIFCMDDMVPKDHMLRKIEKAINWRFIYDLVEEKYCLDNGRPSLDPVILIKLVFIQYLYGSMISVTFAAVLESILPRIFALDCASIFVNISATNFKSSVIVLKIAAASFGFIVEYVFTYSSTSSS